MLGVAKVYALVVVVSLLVGVHAVKDDVSCLGFGHGAVDNLGQRHALPLGDGAPSFHAVVARDLSARGQRLEIVERELQRFLDELADLKPPRRLAGHRVHHIVHGQRRRIAVGLEIFRYVCLGKFLGQLVSPCSRG